MSGESQLQWYASLCLSACQLGPGNSPHVASASIHKVDDDSLLNVFYLYRLFFSGIDDDPLLNVSWLYRLLFLAIDDDKDNLKGGKKLWVGECWWYKLIHVCQRWRNLIFRSASYLRLSLFCTMGTPVAYMLAHSPPLPLVINYDDGLSDITREDKERVILALKQRDRVRRVRLVIRFSTLRKLIVAMEETFPILEDLIVWSWSGHITTLVALPFHAPHLRHLVLVGFTLAIGSPLPTTATHLVTLCLFITHPSLYVHPNTLLRWLSFIPQLETLNISFHSYPNSDEERQFTHPPVMTPVTLPNFHHFSFQGRSTYLDALVHRITPCPEKLEITFFDQNTFSVPSLPQFIETRWNLKLESAKFEFSLRKVFAVVYPRGEAEMDVLSLLAVNPDSWDLNWLASSVAQISNLFRQIFAAVERLTLELTYDVSHNRIDRIEWRQLLNLFSNVKTLHIDNLLVKEVSRCLESNDGEFPLQLLPELQELTCSGSGNSGDMFTSFIDARQNAGRPITLTRC